MPKNKNAQARYLVLDRCLSNPYREFTVYDLMEKCIEELGVNVSRRTILYDLDFIESSEGWGNYGVEIDRLRNDHNKVYFRYKDTNKSIRNSLLSQNETEQLKEAIVTLNRFKGMPQFGWIDEIVSRLEDSFSLANVQSGVIGFEQNPYLTGIEHLGTLFGYIVNRRCVEVEYQKYNGNRYKWSIHPYYIKQYNQRWFLFGWNDYYNTISNIPLDRIASIVPIEKEYKDANVDFDEYFDDIIGVTIPEGGEVEEVLLRFDQSRFSYVRSKPLHWSQKIKDKEECIVSIKVIPNKELVSQIFSFGPDVEVLAPQSLREEIMQQVRMLTKKYSECK
ncbi:MAG: WYL domain-containing protein [Alistipes sp.]|nr:WYL domain-containing protein [Alistipes sp.]